ncbi:MAG: hypothetical protein ACREGF_00215 [Candidatus Saccharimonadales bacterium]
MSRPSRSRPHKSIVTFRPWYFLLLAGVSVIVAVFGLRANNLHMAGLRSQVYAADKANGNVELVLKNLQTYVTQHMNTNLTSGAGAVYPPIQLQYTYGRLEAAKAQAVQATNQSLYTAAENYCQAQIPTGFSGRYRIGCIDNYITSHGAAVQAVPAGLYEFNFLSPRWSPDLAGFSFVAAAIFVLAFVVMFLAERWIKFQSR